MSKEYSLASDTWDIEEIKAINKVIDGGRYTCGAFVEKFEKDFCKILGCKHAVMVNSGSSANLLVMSLLKYKYNLKGDVIVPAVSWSTTFFPVSQNGFKLNFVDVDRKTLNIDPEKVEKAITKDTCAIFAVNLLGNSCYLKELKRIAKKYKLKLIEDNCESLGATSDNSVDFTGTVGNFGTFSFFFSHHIQTMEGGMIVCKSKDDADYLRSLRSHGWCRHLDDKNNLYQKTGDDFVDSFTFITPGYNVRPLEMSGAIGSVQLKKFHENHWVRYENSKLFKKIIEEKFQDVIDIQEEVGFSSWFGFSMLLKGKLKDRRKEVTKLFSKRGIECRPIVAGNFMKNPVIEKLDYIDNEDYENADYIHNQGLFVGNDVVDLTDSIFLLADTLDELL
jgi:CDP-6-deoxy-D-xylo-4-hexulose-3-dehydrase